MLGHKINLNKFTKIESYQVSFLTIMKLEISKRKKAGKFTNRWKLNNGLLNNQGVKEEIKRAKETTHLPSHQKE